jgi:hypothetical protein
VDIALSEEQVVLCGGVDVWDAKRIPVYIYRPVQPGSDELSIGAVKRTSYSIEAPNRTTARMTLTNPTKKRCSFAGICSSSLEWCDFSGRLTRTIIGVDVEIIIP